MREPRFMKCPNGGILNVDVTLLQFGLGECKKIARNVLLRKEFDEGVAKAALSDICEVVRRTLYEIEDYEMTDEANQLVRENGFGDEEE